MNEIMSKLEKLEIVQGKVNDLIADLQSLDISDFEGAENDKVRLIRFLQWFDCTLDEVIEEA